MGADFVFVSLCLFLYDMMTINTIAVLLLTKKLPSNALL